MNKLFFPPICYNNVQNMALFVCIAINNNKANSDQHDAIYRSKIVLDAKPKRFGWVSKQINTKTYYQVQYIKY